MTQDQNQDQDRDQNPPPEEIPNQNPAMDPSKLPPGAKDPLDPNNPHNPNNPQYVGEEDETPRNADWKEFKKQKAAAEGDQKEDDKDE